VIGPEEAISLMDAIRLYTWNGAYLAKEEEGMLPTSFRCSLRGSRVDDRKKKLFNPLTSDYKENVRSKIFLSC
jgi:hypothetical protein